jgi:dTDP-4-amino-4,6-dideoxygalactose transaminase
MTINVTKSSLPELEKYVEYLRKIWSTRWLTNDGEFVKLLERKLEAYLRIKDLVLVSNGTLALQLAIRALELKGEVITTPFTFAATTNVILWEGLTPVFADIDPETYNIDPKEVVKKITKKTSAILAVHVYGNPCYVEELKEIASTHALKLIYDAAHAFGVEYKKRSVLNNGDVTTLSFHATKVFNTIEGGAIVVKDENLLEKLKLLRNHGIKSEEQVLVPGTNAKMNEFQAAMGLCNLENVDRCIKMRKTRYEYYQEKMSRLGNVGFQKIVASRYNYIYMPVLFENKRERDQVFTELVKNDIKPRKYFFPLATDFDYFKKKGLDLARLYNLKKAKDISNRILCLPLYPDLETRNITKIVEIIKSKIEGAHV